MAASYEEDTSSGASNHDNRGGGATDGTVVLAAVRIDPTKLSAHSRALVDLSASLKKQQGGVPPAVVDGAAVAAASAASVPFRVDAAVESRCAAFNALLMSFEHTYGLQHGRVMLARDGIDSIDVERADAVVDPRNLTPHFWRPMAALDQLSSADIVATPERATVDQLDLVRQGRAVLTDRGIVWLAALQRSLFVPREFRTLKEAATYVNVSYRPSDAVPLGDKFFHKICATATADAWRQTAALLKEKYGILTKMHVFRYNNGEPYMARIVVGRQRWVEQRIDVALAAYPKGKAPEDELDIEDVLYPPMAAAAALAAVAAERVPKSRCCAIM